MNRQHQAGQANTEYVVIIGLVAVGLIVIIGIFALALKWNFSRTAGALAGGNEAGQAEAVAQGQAEMERQLAKANRSGSRSSGLSDDEEGGPGSSATEDPSGYAPGRHPASYQHAPGLSEPEPETVSASALGREQGSLTKYYNDSSNVETGEFAGYYGGRRASGGSRSSSGSGPGSIFGIPWYFLLLLLLVLVAVFYFWATADQ